MRSSLRLKSKKKPYQHKHINKKRYKNKSNGRWALSDDNTLCGLHLDNINEFLRQNKHRRADGKGSWKVMPKDSCEVYKERLKRTASNRQKNKNNSEEVSNETLSISDKRGKKRPRKKNQKRDLQSKKLKNKNKKRTKSSSPSSYYSVTGTGSSKSSNTCTDDMEYD